MNQKFLWLFVALIFVFCCSPLGAEEDNPWDNVLQFKPIEEQKSNSNWFTVGKNLKGEIPLDISASKVTTNSSRQKASPLDFCNGNPFTLDCTNSCFLGTFPGGWIWRYQDPRLECPDPYPFEVENYTVWVSNCANVDCEIVLDAGVYAIDTTKQVCGSGGPICPKPGPLLCAWNQLVISIDALSPCIPIGYPDDLGCCVNGPYFIGVHWICPGAAGGCSVNPCLEIFGNDTCGTWYWNCQETSDTVNFRCDLGLPNACITSEGLTRDQNNCPTTELKCSMTNLCVALDSLRPCAQANPLAPDRRYFSFQDPKKACPPSDTCPTYPFEVDAVHLMLANCGPDTGFALLEPSVYRAGYPTDTLCPEPDSLISQGPPFTVKIPPGAECQHFILPLSDTCCVNNPYFASIRVSQTGGGGLEICIDSSCMPYWNYIQFPIHPTPVDPCPLGLTGDFAMWTSGFPFCKNNCPSRDNRGIRALVLEPEPQPYRARLIVKWYTQLGKPEVPKNFSHFWEVYARYYFDPSTYETLLVSEPEFDLKNLADPLPEGCVEVGPPCSEPCPDLADNCVEIGVRVPGGFLVTECVCESEEGDTIYFEFPITTEVAALRCQIRGKDPCETIPEACPVPPLSASPTGYYYIRDREPVDDTLSIPLCLWKAGDVNSDGMYNLADIIGEVNIVFKGAPKPPLTCQTDANADGMTNLTDIIYDVNYVFKGGPKPKASGVCCK